MMIPSASRVFTPEEESGLLVRPQPSGVLCLELHFHPPPYCPARFLFCAPQRFQQSNLLRSAQLNGVTHGRERIDETGRDKQAENHCIALHLHMAYLWCLSCLYACVCVCVWALYVLVCRLRWHVMAIQCWYFK